MRYVLVLIQMSDVWLLRFALYGTLTEGRSYLLCLAVEENYGNGLSIWAEIDATSLAI